MAVPSIKINCLPQDSVDSFEGVTFGGVTFTGVSFGVVSSGGGLLSGFSIKIIFNSNNE